MPQLGDFFSDELREQIAMHQLKIGSVLRLHDERTTPPKIKLWVIIGLERNNVLLAYLYINSNINPTIFSSPALKDLHLKLEATGRDYLEHDSFVDCSRMNEADVELIKTRMTHDVRIHLGELSTTDLEDVVEKVKNARTIPRNVKRKYGLL
jgi:hypothetical protein